MDIQITNHYNRDKVNICGVSPSGVAWIFANMGSVLKSVITIDREGLEEVVAIMKKDGLTVEE